MRSSMLITRIPSSTVAKGIFVVLFTVFFLCMSSTASAQKPRIITFDAPGADKTAGDNNGTYPAGINVWGVIAGAYQDTNSVFHGFLRHPDGKIVTFDVPEADLSPFNGTSPSAINDLGVITGSYADVNSVSHGFLRFPDGKITTFDPPDVGGFGTTPLALNLEGAVVGFYTDSNSAFRAFLRRPDGKISTWVGPNECTGNGSEGCFGSGASNINAFGIVAGGFEDNGGNFVHHSFIRNLEGNLKVFDVPGAGTGSYQGTSCPGCTLGENQFGAIAGIYSDSNNVNHGFVRSLDGKITKFDAPGAGKDPFEGTGCPSDCPVSLNNFGAITGIYIDSNDVFHGYLRSPAGKFVTVDPKGTVFTFPVGINDFGSTAGYYIDANDVYHGYLTLP